MYADQAMPKATPEAMPPRLFQQCEQMEKILHCIHEQARRLEQAANRLTNPRPQAVEKVGPPEMVKPNTVEQLYAMLIGNAEKINARLSEVATHFESAV